MDIPRPDRLRRQRIRRISLVGGAGVVLGLATLGVSRLEPGDEVILSDTSAWSGYDRIRLN